MSNNTPNFNQPTNPIANQVVKTLSTPSNTKKKNINFYMILSFILVFMLIIVWIKTNSNNNSFKKEIARQEWFYYKCLDEAKDFFAIKQYNKEIWKLTNEKSQVQKEINLAESNKDKAANRMMQKEWIVVDWNDSLSTEQWAVMMNWDGSLSTEQWTDPWAHD